MKDFSETQLLQKARKLVQLLAGDVSLFDTACQPMTSGTSPDLCRPPAHKIVYSEDQKKYSGETSAMDLKA